MVNAQKISWMRATEVTAKCQELVTEKVISKILKLYWVQIAKYSSPTKALQLPISGRVISQASGQENDYNPQQRLRFGSLGTSKQASATLGHLRQREQNEHSQPESSSIINLQRGHRKQWSRNDGTQTANSFTVQIMSNHLWWWYSTNQASSYSLNTEGQSEGRHN